MFHLPMPRPAAPTLSHSSRIPLWIRINAGSDPLQIHHRLHSQHLCKHAADLSVLRPITCALLSIHHHHFRMAALTIHDNLLKALSRSRLQF
ncbi:hypothetical protein BD779DRAFT_1489294 [Infundibulicybe gibba]|nr:hypothetical protein BD779DRAFT_1489294 [Infundibulicybe gibba]